MGNSDYRAVKSYLEFLLIHLLKCKYQPERKTRSWADTLRKSRKELQHLFDLHPSLNNKATAYYLKAYAIARMRAAKQTGLSLKTFPEAPPWAYARALDKSFFP